MNSRRDRSLSTALEATYHELLDYSEFSVSMGSTSVASTYMRKKMFEKNVPVLNVYVYVLNVYVNVYELSSL